MDEAVRASLEELRPELRVREDTARLGATHPALAPFLVNPFPISCVQGEHRFHALALAVRDGAVLFAIPDTRQYGVGVMCSENVAEAAPADRRASLRLALSLFLRAPRRLQA